jgi:hypothetical protein
MWSESEPSNTVYREKAAPLYSALECSIMMQLESVFVDLLRRPGIDSQPGGPVRNPIYRTGPPGYIGWRNRFLGIDSWAPCTFTNTGSGHFL